MKKIISLSLIVFCVMCSLYMSSCQEFSFTKKHSAPSKTNFKVIKPDNFEQYSDAKMYNISINIATKDVVGKATEIKDKLSQIPDFDPQNFSINESSANMSGYFSDKDAEKIIMLISKDPEITSLSKNHSNVGSSYVDYSQRFYAYQALAANYDKIMEVIDTNNSYPVDAYTLKKIIDDQMRSYKSSLDSYEKQINKTYFQVYISKTS